MKRRFRVTRNEDFQEIIHNGKSVANRCFVVYYYKRMAVTNDRVGISVSKKIGNSVVRHRLKRQVRECFRTHWQQWKSGHDIIVIARKGSNEQQYQVISGSLLQLMKKHGLERGLEKE